jgi:glycosyltransferase involved in cell wall biosynthesis
LKYCLGEPILNPYYNPLVSVIINNFNYCDFLDDAINSALSQTYQNLEVIVVDDGSTDDSKRIIEKYLNRITAVFKKNGGQSSALNIGFKECLGEIICFLDADDAFFADKVSQVVKVFAKNSEVQWCFHKLLFVDRNNNSLSQQASKRSEGEWDYRDAIVSGKQMPYIPTATSGLCFRRSLLSKICPIPEAIRITSDNYLKFTASALGKGYFINKLLSSQKIHGSNAYTFRDDKEQIKAEVLITTAYWIRIRYPFLSVFTNGLMIRGIGMSLKVGHIRSECRQLIIAYFRLTHWFEYLKIPIMVIWYWIKSYAIVGKVSR